eukprot:PhM_4_TR1421/c0_g1_i1/m.66680
MEEVVARRTLHDAHLRHHVAVVSRPHDARLAAGPSLHKDLVALELLQVVTVNVHGLEALLGALRDLLLHRRQHFEWVRRRGVACHLQHIGAALVEDGVVAERHHLDAVALVLRPHVPATTSVTAAAPPLHFDGRNNVLSLGVCKVVAQTELNQRQHLEREEGAHKRLQAVDALVADVVVRRVQGPAAIAHGAQLVLVGVRLRTCHGHGELHLLDDRAGQNKVREALVRPTGQLEHAELARQLRKGVHDLHLVDAWGHLRHVHQPGGEVAGHVEEVRRVGGREGHVHVLRNEVVRKVELAVVQQRRVTIHTPLHVVAVHRKPHVFDSELDHVVRSVLEAVLGDADVHKLLRHAQGFVRAVGLLEGFLSAVEIIVHCEVLRIGHVNLAVLRDAAVLEQREGVLPVLHLDVQLEKRSHVPELDKHIARGGVGAVAAEVRPAQPQRGVLGLGEGLRDLLKLVHPATLAGDGDCLREVTRSNVQLAGLLVVTNVLGPARLAPQQVLECVVARAHGLRLVPHLEIAEHLLGTFLLPGALEATPSLDKVALEGVDLGHEDVVIRRRAFALEFDTVKQLYKSNITHTDKRLACNCKVEVQQRLHGESPPVPLGDAEAGDAVGRGEVLQVHVAVHGVALRHVDGHHVDGVQAEDLRAFEPDDEARQLLVARRQVPCLDTNHIVAAEAEEVLELAVPGNAVRVVLLVDELLGVEVVHGAHLELVHDGELLARQRHVEAAHARVELQQSHRERVVDEDLEDRAALHTDEKTLTVRRTADGLDVANGSVDDPFPTAVASKVEQLQLLIKTEHNVVAGDDEKVALDLAEDPLPQLVL